MTPDPATRYLANKLTAIEAIAGGRLDEALAILLLLREGPRPIQQGICRYCGCSVARGCAIVSTSSGVLGACLPDVARCEWADDECTVCTNVSCLERWRRDAPAEMDVDLHDASAAAAPQSRIVRP